MSWNALLDLIAEEVGMERAKRIEQRARLALGGVRITVSTKAWITPELVEQTAPGHPRKAAQKLGIAPSTAYRMIRRPIVR